MKNFAALLLLAFALLSLLSPPMLSAASLDSSGQGISEHVAITDMLGRKVTIPRNVRRVLALHPIPTTLIALLAPEKQVSVDTVFQRALDREERLFSDAEYDRLNALPVTNVYFAHIDLEQVMSLHPDVVVTMVSDREIDREQQVTGIPFVAVSKYPTSDYATTIRLLGSVLGRQRRAEEMAGFWARTTNAVQERASRASYRPTVLYTGGNGDTLSASGKDTVFASSIVMAGGRNIGDLMPATVGARENREITIEQAISWNPDVILASGSSAKYRFLHDPLFRSLKAVASGRVYTPRAYAGLDGLAALLGLVWTQGVLLDGDSREAQVRLEHVMQDYYTIFYGHRLTSRQLVQSAKNRRTVVIDRRY